MLLPPINTQAGHGLYFPRVGNQVEIYLGETLITKVGTLGDSSTDAAKSPLWVALPAASLSLSSATPLRVVVSAQASRWGGLAAPYFGPENELYPVYRERYVWRQWGAVAVVFSLALMAALSGTLWALEREVLYGYFALGASMGVVRYADRLLDQPPLPWPLWGAVAATALSAHVLLLMRFILALIGRDNAAVRKTFWFVVVLEFGASFYAFFAAVPWVWTAALALLIPFQGVVLFLLFKAAWKERRREAVAASVASLLVVSAGMRDFLIVRVSSDGSGTFSILPIATMVFVLLMGWLIADRYVRQSRAYKNLLTSMDEKIRLREGELEVSNAILRQEQTQQATLQERQRIMRDIHDGVGAHLVGLINMIRKGSSANNDLQEHASAALDELRMAVDAMQPVHGDLATVMATLRYRLQPRLVAAGIEVNWHIGELPARDDLTPKVVLEIQRIMLEAFTNVLRHAQATRISVSVRFVSEPLATLVVELVDNGIGFSAQAELPGGQGLRNMRARATTIGADMQISRHDAGGTRVALTLRSL